MKIYTSYFNNIDNIDKDIVLISVSPNTPIWFSGNIQRDLIPELKHIKSGTLMKSCKNAYTEQLNNIKINNFIKAIKNISNGNSVVLLSDELPTEFSHRVLIRKWLDDNKIKNEEL